MSARFSPCFRTRRDRLLCPAARPCLTLAASTTTTTTTTTAAAAAAAAIAAVYVLVVVVIDIECCLVDRVDPIGAFRPVSSRLLVAFIPLVGIVSLAWYFPPTRRPCVRDDETPT